MAGLSTPSRLIAKYLASGAHATTTSPSTIIRTAIDVCTFQLTYGRSYSHAMEGVDRVVDAFAHEDVRELGIGEMARNILSYKA